MRLRPKYAGLAAIALGVGLACNGSDIVPGSGGQGGGVGCPTDCGGLKVEPCQRAECDSHTGRCVVHAAPEGTACDDGKVCTVGDACHAGACTGAPNSCGVTAPPC